MSSTTTNNHTSDDFERPRRSRRPPAYLNDYELHFNFRTANTVARQYRQQAQLNQNTQRAQRATRQAQQTRQRRASTVAASRRSNDDDSDDYTPAAPTTRTASTRATRASTRSNNNNTATTRATTRAASTTRATTTRATRAAARATSAARNNTTTVTATNTARNTNSRTTAVQDHGPSPVQLEIFRSKLTPASQCKHNWAISEHETKEAVFYTKSKTERRLTVEELLNSCRFHPGLLHDTGKKPAVEIVFSFDTTTSMFPAISELKKKLSDLLKQLLRDLPDIRIAIIAHGDYCAADRFFGSQCYPVMYKLDFTNDLDTLMNFIYCIKGGGGLDLPEAYEFSLMECERLNWFKNDLTKDEYDDDISRVLVMMGDDQPHGADDYFKINWKTQLEALHNKMLIKAYGIKCLNKTYSHEFYQELADSTYGTKLDLSNFNKMHELVLGLCYREAAEHASIQYANRLEAESSQSSSTDVTTDAPAAATSTVPVEGTEQSGDGLSDADTLAVHSAIHDPNQSSVTVQGVQYEISVNPTECRFARINDIVYVEQSKQKNTKYAQMAKAGHKVTWICHKGAWGLIVDDAIQRR